MWLDMIASVFLVKKHGSRNYYLGNNYIYHETQDMWTYGYKMYATDDVVRVESLFGCLPKVSTHIPVTDCHPELANFPLMGLDDHLEYQMLLEMLQWMVTIVKSDLCQ